MRTTTAFCILSTLALALAACSSQPPRTPDGAPAEQPAPNAPSGPDSEAASGERAGAAPQPIWDDTPSPAVVAGRERLEAGDHAAALTVAREAIAADAGDTAALALQVDALRAAAAPEDELSRAQMALEAARSRRTRARAGGEVRRLLDQARQLTGAGRYENARTCVDRARLLLRMSPLDNAPERAALATEVDVVDRELRVAARDAGR